MSDEKKGKTLFDAGNVCVGKDGKSLYIKIKKDFTVKEGDYINLQTPQESLEKLHELGYLTEEELESRLDKIPDWIKYQINVGNQ